MSHEYMGFLVPQFDGTLLSYTNNLLIKFHPDSKNIVSISTIEFEYNNCGRFDIKIQPD